MPWPLHDVAWGPSPRLYQCGLDPVNQVGPVIVTWGGKKVVYFEKAIEVMLMFQVFDGEGKQLELKVSSLCLFSSVNMNLFYCTWFIHHGYIIHLKDKIDDFFITTM